MRSGWDPMGVCGFYARIIGFPLSRRGTTISGLTAPQLFVFSVVPCTADLRFPDLKGAHALRTRKPKAALKSESCQKHDAEGWLSVFRTESC